MAGTCKYGIDFVAVVAFQEVPAKPAIFFHVTDDRFDRRAAFEFAFDLRCHTSFLT